MKNLARGCGMYTIRYSGADKAFAAHNLHAMICLYRFTGFRCNVYCSDRCFDRMLTYPVNHNQQSDPKKNIVSGPLASCGCLLILLP